MLGPEMPNPKRTPMSGRSALARKEPSLLARFLVERELVSGRIFDWGCGRGRDVEFYINSGIDSVGWDPAHFPDHMPGKLEKGLFQWVSCAYVLNTIPSS